MDKIKALIDSMTIWNWLTLVAFLALPFTFLNAILGLRSRLKDWGATRNKKKFKNRLNELQKQFHQVKRYQDNPQHFTYVYNLDLLRILYLSVVLVGIFIANVALVVTFYAGNYRPSVFMIPASMLLGTAYLSLFVLYKIVKLRRLTRRVMNLFILIREVQELIEKGKTEGFDDDEVKLLITSIQEGFRRFGKTELLTLSESEP